jgi:hypothetical protein
MAFINREPESTRMGRCTPVEYQIKDRETWKKVFCIQDDNNNNKTWKHKPSNRRCQNKLHYNLVHLPDAAKNEFSEEKKRQK